VLRGCVTAGIAVGGTLPFVLHPIADTGTLPMASQAWVLGGKPQLLYLAVLNALVLLAVGLAVRATLGADLHSHEAGSGQQAGSDRSSRGSEGRFGGAAPPPISTALSLLASELEEAGLPGRMRDPAPSLPATARDRATPFFADEPGPVNESDTGLSPGRASASAAPQPDARSQSVLAEATVLLLLGLRCCLEYALLVSQMSRVGYRDIGLVQGNTLAMVWLLCITLADGQGAATVLLFLRLILPGLQQAVGATALRGWRATRDY
jgi:hypothetical protein